MSVIGGRPFNFTKAEIERRMTGVRPEPIQKQLVEVQGTVYPPKQVVETMTGWHRRTYTTHEAERALTRAGLVCRAARADDYRRQTQLAAQPTDGYEEFSSHGETLDARLARIEVAQTIDQEAIASLIRRVEKLETSAR
jgi:hypothetical protein